jgi:hypothetical protein
MSEIPPALGALLEVERERPDLHAEMSGLAWDVGVVDLGGLYGFQRRLIFDPGFLHDAVPAQEDWPGLVKLAFGAAVPIEYRTLERSAAGWTLQSGNPNLQLRACATRSDGLALHGGSPFVEVANYRGRWFLRDGYHRAYRLLRAGVRQVPAVLIRARTLAELGPGEPWFFSEETLLGASPPRLTDFLEDQLTVNYQRPRLLKTLRVTIAESLEPAIENSTSGEQG